MNNQSNKYILILDDNKSRRGYLASKIRRQFPFSIDTTDSGLRGLSSAEDGKYSVILISSDLSDMSLVEFLVVLDSIKLPKIKILLNAGQPEYEVYGDDFENIYKSLGIKDVNSDQDLFKILSKTV